MHVSLLGRLAHHTVMVWVCLLAMAGSALAALPPAGTRILNTATAEYDNPINATQKKKTASNTTVVEITAAFLTADQLVTTSPGSTVTWQHVLSNNGSAADNYTLSVSDLGGDSGVLSGLHLVFDANGNGQEDPGEALPDGTVITLNSGATASLLIRGIVPVNADEGFHYKTRLTVASKLDPAGTMVRDDDSVVSGPLIQLTKTVSTAAAKRGDSLVYTLSMINRNAYPALPALVSINGAIVPRMVVDDPIPANVRLKEAPVYAGPGQVIYHLAESSAGLYVTTPPTDFARVDRIGLAYTSFNGNQSDELRFTAIVPDDVVQNTVANQFTFLHRLADIDRTVFSNPVTTLVESGLSPRIVNKEKQYLDLALRIRQGDDLYLEATCSACNTQSGRRDYLVIQVTSGNNPKNDGVLNSPLPAFYDAQGKDAVTVTALETGPNTGVFRVVHFGEWTAAPGVDPATIPTIGIPTHVYGGGAIDTADESLETIRHDILQAKILFCLNPDLSHGQTVKISSQVLVDPFGVVFDSQTNQEISGAQVRLVYVDGAGNVLPDAVDVWDDNGVACTPGTANLPGTPVPAPAKDPDCVGNVLTTTAQAGKEGQYRFPLVQPSIPGVKEYALQVTPPAGYAFPSTFTIPAGFMRVVVAGSRGERFQVTPGLGPVEIDIPLDPQALKASLFVRKSSDRTAVELGEFVDYKLEVSNVGSKKAIDVQVQDRLPAGFTYVANSARVDGVAKEPDTGSGIIHFDLDDMDIKAVRTITYRLRVGAVSRNGAAINIATATENTPGGVTSNVASYKVRVTPGVFSTEGFITGKIYTDCNRDGVQGVEEVGVPGVRMYLEDGTYVVSDVEGKFDFYGVRAKTHVLKLDRTTLPRDIEVIEQSVRNGGDPFSRFVDLKPSELHRADFAVTSGSGTCDGPGMEEIFQRRADGDKVIGELERNLKADLPVVPVVLSDVRSLPASGCLQGADQTCGVHGKAKMPELVEQIKSRKGKKARKVQSDLEGYLTTTDRSAAILNLKGGEILPSRQTVIQVKGQLGATFQLTVNGREVPFTRVGKRITVQDTRLEGREYIGVDLDAGQNLIELKLKDPMGNSRGEASVSVVAPGELVALKLFAPGASLSADGESILTLSLILHDKDGVPVTSRTQVTVEANAGQILEEDLDPKQPGTQLFVEGGETTLHLQSPTQPGAGEVVVRSGVLKETMAVRFVPELRPMIATGIAEGMVSFRNFDTAKVSPAMAADGFEEELTSLSSSDNGQLNTTGRLAFFLKGKVKGEYLLTMAYDSDKPSSQALFRDIRPEEYYPVYGDAAAKGFDAQSTGKLYVRVDKGRSYALFGDYNTRIENAPAMELGQYSRSLTGVRAHHETATASTTVFVAQTNSNQQTLEIPALGVSGPYALAGVNGLLVNSEKVEIILRDRNNPGLILSTQAQTRFIDYEFEPLTGSLIFKAPVPSLDANLNPYFIRVTLEVGDNGPEYWVGGVQGQQQLSERLTVGAAAVSEDNPADAYKLGSVNATYKLDADTRVTVEGAASDRESKGVGAAGRVEVVHEKGTAYWRLFHAQSESSFDNTAASVSAGRAESGARLRVNLPQWGLFRVEATRTEDASTNGVRQGLKVSLERKINEHLGLEVGSRIYDESRAAASVSSLGVTPYEGVTAWMKLNAQFARLPGASAFLEYEQDVNDPELRVAAIGGDYRLGTQGRLYARHELISSLSGGNALNDQQKRNTTVVGIEDEYMKDGRVFSEYRVRDAITATESEAAVGLRNRWYLAKDVRFNTNLERTTTLKGADANDATAVSLGLEYLPSELWKATGKLDLRWAKASNTILNQLGLAWKLSRDWTLLTRNTFNLTDNKTTGDKVLDRFQTGLAWRQVDSNRWDALTKLEYRLEDDRSNKLALIDRRSVIVSGHVNYHPVRRLTLAGNVAAKKVQDDSNGLQSDSLTRMAGVRVIRDITERWEASVQGGQVWDDGGQKRYVLGVETGYLAMANLWLSAGYNFLSYKDADLVGNDYTVNGFYLRFRFKFDEDLFNARKPGINKTLEPEENVSP
ncbi:putative repeat protein (TIGR01451 family) [Fluviicoccus keumensis]|uniref:Putative repeat protein (TIGR01451 family) n=1 Tax=Fluviicoccus keumensis TaxID=1435465 RepID=A0A4V2G686_9GAMM|nr:DUF11 domain-containing protein [Fluviicoccus keumensis]RZU47726.1 putative repeat protein (TIGR01451 family) [Fluviicoccus keumensis]